MPTIRTHACHPRKDPVLPRKATLWPVGAEPAGSPSGATVSRRAGDTAWEEVSEPGKRRGLAWGISPRGTIRAELRVIRMLQPRGGGGGEETPWEWEPREHPDHVPTSHDSSRKGASPIDPDPAVSAPPGLAAPILPEAAQELKRSILARWSVETTNDGRESVMIRC